MKWFFYHLPSFALPFDHFQFLEIGSIILHHFWANAEVLAVLLVIKISTSSSAKCNIFRIVFLSSNWFLFVLSILTGFSILSTISSGWRFSSSSFKFSNDLGFFSCPKRLGITSNLFSFAILKNEFYASEANLPNIFSASSNYKEVSKGKFSSVFWKFYSIFVLYLSLLKNCTSNFSD